MFNIFSNPTPPKKVNGFQYVISSNPFRSVTHLRESLDSGVVVDGSHKNQLVKGSVVVVLGGCKDNYYTIVGTATGQCRPGHEVQDEIFEEYDHSDKVLHQVEWETDIIPIPSEIVGRNTNSPSLEVCHKINDYVTSRK